MIPFVCAVTVFAPMLLEAMLARAHDRALRAQGAIEPPGDVYALMQVAYPASFAAMLAEGAWRGVALDGWFLLGGCVFVLAKAIKYWAIASLGPRWTFRVLVPPHSERTIAGPYRWIAHPNYAGVAGELVGCALAMHAIVAGPIAFAGFGLLMLRRMEVEDEALMLGERTSARGAEPLG